MRPGRKKKLSTGAGIYCHVGVDFQHHVLVLVKEKDAEGRHFLGDAARLGDARDDAHRPHYALDGGVVRWLQSLKKRANKCHFKVKVKQDMFLTSWALFSRVTETQSDSKYSHVHLFFLLPNIFESRKKTFKTSPNLFNNIKLYLLLKFCTCSFPICHLRSYIILFVKGIAILFSATSMQHWPKGLWV